MKKVTSEQTELERDYMSCVRLMSGLDLTEQDLDPEFARGSEPSREVGMNLRTQLFALSRDEEKCASGLLKYLGMSDIKEFNLTNSYQKLIHHPKKPLEIKLPVSLCIIYI